MRAAVLLLAIVAFIAIQTVSAGPIVQSNYNTTRNFMCNTTVIGTTNVTNNGGDCKNTVSTSSAYYCAGGANVITVQFSDIDCFAGNISSMTQTPTTCGAGSPSSKWSCTGTDALPGGLTFPPANWQIKTTTYNNTFNDVTGLGESTASCTAPAANRVSIQTATNPGCKYTKASNPIGSGSKSAKSSQMFINDGSAYKATYLGADCVAANLVMLTRQYPQACKDGSTTSFVGSNAPPTRPIGSNGVVASQTSYNGAGCVAANITSQSWASDACVDSTRYQCTGNSTAGFMFRTTTYNGTNGECFSAPTFTEEFVSACKASGDDSYNYLCTPSSPGNSASSVSVSFVSMIIVAFVALIAQ